MKRFFSIAAFALVTSTAITPAVNAQVSANYTTRNNPYVQQLEQQITPSDLVGSAYQGNLQEQGIPQSGTLISEYLAGKVTPEDIVMAAIQAHRLQPTVLKDQGYLNAVSASLDDLSHG